MKNPKGVPNIRIGLFVILYVSFISPGYSVANNAWIKLQPEMVNVANQHLHGRFENIVEFCDQGVLPWSRTAHGNTKAFIRMIYQHNWMAGVFDLEQLRVTALFSDQAMAPYLKTTAQGYGMENFYIFFYNLNRCWNESDHAEEIFAKLAYVLNHHYRDIDFCLSAYEKRYRQCDLATGFHAKSDVQIRHDIRKLYKSVNEINQYFVNSDSEAIWYEQLETNWLSTKNKKEFNRAKAMTKLPVTGINFVLHNIGKLVSHYSSLN